MQEALDTELARAETENSPTTTVLKRLLSIEAASLIERRIERRIKESKLPERKILADFDFNFQPGIDKQHIMELSTLAFIQRKQWLILGGGSGVGKSHIAKALLLMCCKELYLCRYTTASDMLKQLALGACRRYAG